MLFYEVFFPAAYEPNTSQTFWTSSGKLPCIAQVQDSEMALGMWAGDQYGWEVSPLPYIPTYNFFSIVKPTWFTQLQPGRSEWRVVGQEWDMKTPQGISLLKMFLKTNSICGFVWILMTSRSSSCMSDFNFYISLNFYTYVIGRRRWVEGGVRGRKNGRAVGDEQFFESRKIRMQRPDPPRWIILSAGVCGWWQFWLEADS